MHTVEFLGMTSAGHRYSGSDCTAFIADLTLSAGPAFSDGSFEAPALAANAYAVAPAGTSWQYTGMAGVAANGAPSLRAIPTPPTLAVPRWRSSSRPAPSARRCTWPPAPIISRTWRPGARTGSRNTESLEVLVDGHEVGTATPSGTTYGLYATSTFTVAAGMHTIQFVGVNPMGGDNTAFLDEVQLKSRTTGVGWSRVNAVKPSTGPNRGSDAASDLRENPGRVAAESS